MISIGARDGEVPFIRYGATSAIVRVLSEGATVLVEVEDDGPGIAPERLHALQDAIDCRQDSGPAGLGLTLASIVARAHKGRLRLVAGEHGTRVELSFETVSSPAASIADADVGRSESALLQR